MTDLPIEEIPQHAALRKLARVLDVDEPDVAFLADVDADALRNLRDEISSRLHAADEARLGKVAAASRMLPQGLAASIGQNWFGPTLCARLVGLIEPERGGQFAKHLDLDFMADITARTDPRLVGDLVHHLPVAAMQDIAITLYERNDVLTLSHFVGHIPATIVSRILEALVDDAAVVRIAVFVEQMEALDPVVELLPDDRVLRLVQAVEREDLWVEGLYLFGHLGSQQVERVAVTLIDADPALLRAALEAFERHDLWAQGLDVLDAVDGDRLAHLASALIELDDELVLAAIRAFDRNDLWARGLQILGELEGAQVARLATLLLDLDAAVLRAAIAAFHRLGLWRQGLELLATLDGEQIRQIASVLISLDDEIIDGAVAAASEADIWEPLVHAGVAARTLPDEVRAKLGAIIDGQPPGVLEGFDSAAQRLGHAGLREQLLSAPAGNAG